MEEWNGARASFCAAKNCRRKNAISIQYIRKNVCVVWIVAVWRAGGFDVWTFLHKSELTLQKCSHVQEQSADC